MNKDFRHTSGALEDRFFYGRENELKIFFRYIDNRQHTALIGQRQFGKTALILKAMERHESKPLKAHIDLSRKSSLQESSKILIDSFMENNFGMKRFLVYLLTDFTGVVGKVLNSPGSIIKKLKLKDYEVELKELQSAISNEINGIDLFAKAIEFIDTVAITNQTKSILFIDEFQRLKNMPEVKSDWEENLWAIRSAIQDTKLTTVIVAGSQPTIINEMLLGKKSPFLNSFKITKIDIIEKRAFEEHFNDVCKTYNVSNIEPLTSFAYKVCGGVPSYLSLFGVNLFDEVVKNDILNTDMYFNSLEKTINDLSDRFQTIEEKIDNIAHGLIVYKSIYKGNNPLEEAHILSGTSKQNIQNNTINKLLERGFIKKLSRGLYKVVDNMFGLYLTEQEKSEQLKLAYEEEVSKLVY